jgi:predicted transcriptional regulator
MNLIQKFIHSGNNIFFNLKKEKFYFKMASIQSNVQELKEINLEIKRLQTQTKNLKKRATEIEKYIISYLNEKEQPGLKYQNTAIVLENKAQKIRKSKKDTENDTIRILEESGVSNAKEVLKKIADSKNTNKTNMQKIKLQSITK